MGGFTKGIEDITNGITNTLGLGNIFQTDDGQYKQNQEQLKQQQLKIQKLQEENQKSIKDQQDQQLKIQKQIEAQQQDQIIEANRKRRNALNVLKGGGLLQQNNNSLLG